MRELDGRVVRVAREAIQRLREGADKGDEIKKLRDDVEKLQEENRGLKDRLDKLESQSNGAKPRAGEEVVGCEGVTERRAAAEGAVARGSRRRARGGTDFVS